MVSRVANWQIIVSAGSIQVVDGPTEKVYDTIECKDREGVRIASSLLTDAYGIPTDQADSYANSARHRHMLATSTHVSLIHLAVGPEA